MCAIFLKLYFFESYFLESYFPESHFLESHFFSFSLNWNFLKKKKKN